METILIATDFSAVADNAANYGFELAKYFHSKLILLNAYPMPAANYDTGIPPDTITLLQDASLSGLNDLKRKFETSSPGMEIECVSVMGGAYDVIEQVSKEKNVDLAVMGIIGEAGVLKESIIGSTALKAARNLQIPIFIIPQHAKYKRIYKLSFACDMDHTEDTGIIYTAKHFAKLFYAELEVVTVEEPGKERTLEKAHTMNYIEEKLESLSHNTFVVTDKDPVIGLEDYYDNNPCDVILLNPKKHNLFQTIFGTSVTKKIIFHSKVPLLIIH